MILVFCTLYAHISYLRKHSHITMCNVNDLTLFKHLLSETIGPIEAKHMESPWDGGKKICLNAPGHMSKMAAMSIYGKNLNKSSSPEQKGRWPWNGMQHWVFKYYKVCSNDDPVFTLTYFSARSNLVPYAFVWETIVVYDLKLATDDRSDKEFLLMSTLCPLGAVRPPALVLYTCIKQWKKKC